MLHVTVYYSSPIVDSQGRRMSVTSLRWRILAIGVSILLALAKSPTAGT